MMESSGFDLEAKLKSTDANDVYVQKVFAVMRDVLTTSITAKQGFAGDPLRYKRFAQAAEWAAKFTMEHALPDLNKWGHLWNETEAQRVEKSADVLRRVIVDGVWKDSWSTAHLYRQP